MSGDVKNIKEAGEAAASPAFVNVTLSDETVVKVGKLPWMQFGPLYRKVHGLLQGGIKLYVESEKQTEMQRQMNSISLSLDAARADLAQAEAISTGDAEGMAATTELKGEVAGLESALRGALAEMETRQAGVQKLQAELLQAALDIPEVVADLVVSCTKLFKEHDELNELDYDDVLAIAMAAVNVNFINNDKVRRFFGDARLLSGLNDESSKKPESAGAEAE